MSKYLVEESTLTDIADAIREQTGDENPIMLSNFASEISSIVGGGSHVELTQAEYDALTTEEKNNGSVYFITDSANEPMKVYSTTEKAVGIWIDGSIIYEKTLSIPTNLSQDGVQIVDSNFIGDRIISYGGYNASSTAGSYYPLPDGRFRVNLESGVLKIRSINGGTWNGTTYLTIQYTKAST